MAWIKTIKYEDADSALKKIYDRIKGPNNAIDNVLSIHSLRPHTLVGHMALYKNVLHNSNNSLPKWYLEAIGVYVSLLNHCDYCVAHHYEGLKRLLSNHSKSQDIMNAFKDDSIDSQFDSKYSAGLSYAKSLTKMAKNIKKEDIEILKTKGFQEGEILEVNQVTAYFNYVNRLVLGLGVNTEGDILGLSPSESDNPDNWSHQ